MTYKRAHKNRVTYPEEWASIRASVLKRDNYRCTKCGISRSQLRERGEYLQVDHIRRLADGGTNSQSNLRSLCPTCHSRCLGHSHMRRKRLFYARRV